MTLFDSALITITERTHWKNCGILPFIPAVKKLPAEDAVVLEHQSSAQQQNILIAVPMLSRIANFDDFDPLIMEPDVAVRFIRPGTPLPDQADLIILPGTKSTLADLEFLRNQGWDIDILAHVRRGGKVFGICGGYQMLGKEIDDPEGIEGKSGKFSGLGLLDVTTIMKPEKTVSKITAYAPHLKCETSGYEIHIGETRGKDLNHPFLLRDNVALGAMSENGHITGCYMHGLFNDDVFRMKYLAQFRNGNFQKTAFMKQVDNALDTLAGEMEKYLDIDSIVRMAR